MEQRESAVSRGPRIKVSRESSATRECNSRKSNLHAIERGTHLRARSTVETFHRWKKSSRDGCISSSLNSIQRCRYIYIYKMPALCHFDYFCRSLHTRPIYIHIPSRILKVKLKTKDGFPSLKGAKIFPSLEHFRSSEIEDSWTMRIS